MVLTEIVPVNVPELLGLDVMDSEGLYADNVTDRLVHRRVYNRSSEFLEYDDVWSVPIIRHDIHLNPHICFPPSTFCTSAQLLKLHRNFAHPSAEKLCNLLQKAGIDAVTSETLERLQEIIRRCEPCQRIRNGP